MNVFTSARLVVLVVATGFAAGCKSNETESATVNAPNAGGAQAGGIAPTPVGRQRTYSGLQYEMLRPGTGKRPSPHSQVTVHYHGTLTNGTVFDSSVQRGQPFTCRLNQGIIAGWKEGIPLMQEGAKFKFVIPPHLAYGAQGAPPKIGPNETLIFDVELIKVHY